MKRLLCFLIISLMLLTLVACDDVAIVLNKNGGQKTTSDINSDTASDTTSDNTLDTTAKITDETVSDDVADTEDGKIDIPAVENPEGAPFDIALLPVKFDHPIKFGSGIILPNGGKELVNVSYEQIAEALQQGVSEVKALNEEYTIYEQRFYEMYMGEKGLCIMVSTTYQSAGGGFAAHGTVYEVKPEVSDKTDAPDVQKPDVSEPNTAEDYDYYFKTKSYCYSSDAFFAIPDSTWEQIDDEGYVYRWSFEDGDDLVVEFGDKDNKLYYKSSYVARD